MNKRVISFLIFALSITFALPSVSQIQPLPDGKPHVFHVEGGQFTLDGKPFRVISGEIHYPRVPREYWRARFKMARAMGLNTITTYVFWNVHEPTPGVYDFKGNNDVAEFIREAQEEGLYVILRPGPYVCAEWELGGYPAWLLKDPKTMLRSQDPKFLEPATRWIKRLGQELAPLQVGNGGPVILVQVENEYGSFDSDHVYMEKNRQMLVDAGFTKAQLYTADGPAEIAKGSLPDLPIGINFDGNHPGESEKAFATLKKMRPDGPFINSEFWAGWFDHWGGPHAHTSTETQAANLEWTLSHGYSVSIYMFHGGTNFGWMNGANSDDKRPAQYQPDVTSYDYDSALDESGRTTHKYFVFRDVIAKATGVTPPAVPEVAAPIAIPQFTLSEAASLWDNLPKPIESDHPLTMEDVGQNYGWILYRANAALSSGTFTIHDYAINNVSGGEFDRRTGKDRTMKVNTNDRVMGRFDLLVENSGRVNFSHQLQKERKGVVAYTPPSEGAPSKWLMYPLPMTNPAAMHFTKAACSGPCFYRGSFTVDHPADTFLDTSNLTKGQLWVNGHAMGRFWKVGPQRTLYLPGPWLKAGKNEVIVFDVDGRPGSTLEGLAKPNLGPVGLNGPDVVN